MKTLANCSPREFLVQTNKIRKSAYSWMQHTQIMDIRNRMPEIKKGMTAAEIEAEKKKQVIKNLNEVLDKALEEYPEETADLLGLVCFINPEDLDNYKMADLLSSVTEIINCPEVVDFFTSLASLNQPAISGIARA